MAGEAKTTQMLLSTATLMIGPTASVYALNPATHGVGLVKNVQVQTDMGYIDLTQGINNQLVMSVQNKLDTKITAEVYEYTAANLAYAGGLDGSTKTTLSTAYILGTAITTGGTSVVLSAAPSGGDVVAGSVIVIQDTANPDRVHVGRVASISTATITLTAATAMPSGTAFPIATTTVMTVNEIQMGPRVSQPTFGCKLVGLLPSTGKPITLIFPKVKIQKGMNVAFETNNFTNLPFELVPYTLTATDPLYADFGSNYYSILAQ